MISNITLHNFKAFDELSVDFAPITILVGPNNSGKSSIHAALRLLAQTLDGTDNQTQLLLTGGFGDFGTYKDLVYRNFGGRAIGISISVRSNFQSALPRSKLPMDWIMGTDTMTLDLEFKYRVRRRELILRRVTTSLDGEPLLDIGYSNDSGKNLVNSIGKVEVPSAIKSLLSQQLLRMDTFMPSVRTFLNYEQREQPSLRDFYTKEIEQSARRSNEVVREIRYFLSRIDYIGAMRLPPLRTYLFTGQRPRRIGAAGENTAGLLSLYTSRDATPSGEVLELLKKWLSDAGIASNIRVDAISDRHFEILVQHPVTKEYENLVDVGQGNSQVLPVLLGGFQRAPTSTYIVEEPEIHLHPRAQATLGDFVLQLYQRRVQSIIETHSEYLVVRLQQHVASKAIPPDHVRFYYVLPSENGKDVVSLRLDDKGRFIDEWPEGFFPERLDEAKKLSRIRYASDTEGAEDGSRD